MTTKRIIAVLLVFLSGAAACEKLDPAAGSSLDAASTYDGSVAPDLSRNWVPPPGKQAGQVVLTAKGAPIGKVVVGASYTLSFLVDTVTTYDDLYRFSLSAIDVKGALISDWNRGVVVAAETGIEIGKPQLVTAKFTVPAGAKSAALVFRAESAGGIKGNAFPLRLVVGEIADLSDPRVTPSVRTVWMADQVTRSADIVIDGTTLSGVQVAFGSTGRVDARLLIDAMAPGAAGAFRFSAEIEGSPGDWSVNCTPTQFDDIPAGMDLLLNLQLQNKLPSGNLTPSYLVVRAAHLPSPGAANPDYTSWARVPIQGYVK